MDYTLTLALKVVAIKISPSFSSSTSFSCPLTEDDIASALGTDVSSLAGLLGSLSGSGLKRSLEAWSDAGGSALVRKGTADERAGGYFELVRRLVRMIQRLDRRP